MKKWIKRLAEDEAGVLLQHIAQKISGDDDDTVKMVLNALVEKLDEFDSEDMLGTDGWRVAYGLEECGR